MPTPILYIERHKAHPFHTKGHTHAMCIYTMGRRPPLSSTEHLLEISYVSTGQKKTLANVFLFMIDPAQVFIGCHRFASLPSKTSAKVMKIIGNGKKSLFFFSFPSESPFDRGIPPILYMCAREGVSSQLCLYHLAQG